MKKIVVLAVIAGLVITLITGFIETTSGMLGATWYGWPLAWRIVPVVLDPVASYKVVEFVSDFVVWFIVAFLILFMVKKLKRE